MATRLHTGAKDLRGDIATYAKRFDLLEVRGPSAENLRLAPSAATLRKWRKNVSPAFEFVVIGGPNVGKLKASEALETELEAMIETATVLEARTLLIATPPDVTPSKLWRDRFAKLLERLPRDARSVVWEPSGLWEIDDAAKQAKQWGVVLCVDPSRDPVPSGPVAYGRLRALGATRTYSTAALLRVTESIGERREAFVVFETQGALKEAKSLKSLFRASGATKGGLGRLIRPKGAIVQMGDDLDEDDEE